MSIEDTFEGAKNAFPFFFAYINSVGQEIGIERANALLTQMQKAMGAGVGAMMKEQAGIETVDASGAFALSKGFVSSLGIEFEATEESPQCAAFTVGRCPVFAGAQMTGMDLEAIEASCRAGALKFMDAVVKQFNPGLSYELRKFRSSAEDACEEAIVLT